MIEYVPYRKGEATAIDDSIRQRYLAAHGFACLRVDVRGSGESDGVLLDEYSAQELADGCEVVEWLASQPWCSGRVGLMGISWGGFNALQIAALRPPALAAVISACSTDDRYTDDAHYRGGCVLARDMLGWATTLQALSSRPPDPAIVGAGWRAQWMERLEQTPHYVETWLAHPQRDDYWRHGSVCEDFAAIECPVFVVGGLADGYTNAVPRLMRGLSVPRRGLLGPWAHSWPHAARPGPTVGFLQECVRWFGHWLRDDAGDPGSGLRIWLQTGCEPATSPKERPGRWIEEPKPKLQALHLTRNGLSERAGDGETLEVSTDLGHGQDAGAFCPFVGDLPADQRDEDARALVFDAPPATRATVLAGVPVLKVAVSASDSDAQLIARLCDVAPDGASLLLGRGVLNLAQATAKELELDVVAHELAPGHHLRLALAPSYWPLIWPAPRPVTLSIRTSGSVLELPVCSPEQLVDAPADLGPPEGAPPLAYEVVSKASGPTSARVRLPDGLESWSESHDEHSLDDDPLSARVDCRRRYWLKRDDWQVRVEVDAHMTCSVDSFQVQTQVRGYEAEACVHEHRWTSVHPRSVIP